MVGSMSDIPHDDDARARKRLKDRERIRAIRAGLSPEERAEQRREHDAAYRELHRDRRRAYDREYRRKA